VTLIRQCEGDSADVRLKPDSNRRRGNRPALRVRKHQGQRRIRCLDLRGKSWSTAIGRGSLVLSEFISLGAPNEPEEVVPADAADRCAAHRERARAAPRPPTASPRRAPGLCPLLAAPERRDRGVISRVAFLSNPATVKQAVSGTEAAGQTLGVQVSTLLVRNASEVDAAFATMKSAHVGGLIVDLTLQEHSRQIVDLALKSRLPTVSGPRKFVEAGGLMAYGPQFSDLFRRAATYIDKILKGAAATRKEQLIEELQRKQRQ